MRFSCINECFQTITDEDVLEAMQKIPGLPVENNDDIITGVISEKDFLSRMNKKKAPSFVQVLLQCVNTSGCIAVPFKTLKVREVKQIENTPCSFRCD